MKSIHRNLLYILSAFLFLAGCASKNHDNYIVERAPLVISKPIKRTIEEKPTHVKKYVKKRVKKTTKKHTLPKKKIKLKKVEDTNYDDSYMYPEDTKAAKKDFIERQKSVVTPQKSMTKEACIAMIGQEKFDKYTTMFGSEASSIKRCVMLKAMSE